MTVFFFSSRRRHTRYWRDWSSDVCSSDLSTDDLPLGRALREEGYHIHLLKQPARVSHPHYTFGRWWTQMHRWLVIIRRYWPNNFLITSVVDLAPWWALLYLLVSLLAGDGIVLGACLLTAALGTRS